jgi:hypothetical protein
MSGFKTILLAVVGAVVLVGLAYVITEMVSVQQYMLRGQVKTEIASN